MQELSPEWLQELQNLCTLQRNYLLSSIHELLSQQDTAVLQQDTAVGIKLSPCCSAAAALCHALDASKLTKAFAER